MVANATAINEVHTNYVAIHPYYGYVCLPNSTIDFQLPVPKEFGHGTSIQTDADGFRNKNVPSSKPPDEYWVGLFGGSVAFSILSSDNEWTIAGRLEKMLNEALPHRKIRVFNFALPGGQQPQQLHIFLHKSAKLDGIITFDGYNEYMVPARFPLLIPEHFPFFSLLFSSLCASK